MGDWALLDKEALKTPPSQVAVACIHAAVCFVRNVVLETVHGVTLKLCSLVQIQLHEVRSIMKLPGIRELHRLLFSQFAKRAARAKTPQTPRGPAPSSRPLGLS